jgi:RNA-directed DNA polymerase
MERKVCNIVGGVISPLLSNIMLHEFDKWMEGNYLNKKVRKDRWAWNFAILKQRPIAVREDRQQETCCSLLSVCG